MGNRKHRLFGSKSHKGTSRPDTPATRNASWDTVSLDTGPDIDDISRAHQLLAGQEYKAASDLFARVAALAAGRQRFRQAAQLYAQALFAALQGGNITVASAHADRALAALFQDKNIPYMLRLTGRLQAQMKQLDFAAQAHRLHDKIGAHLEELGLSSSDVDQIPTSPASAPQPGTHTSLPDQCPACSGPVYSDEVEWAQGTKSASEAQAHCAYCEYVIESS